MESVSIILFLLVAFVVIVLFKTIKIVPQKQVMVVERLGRSENRSHRSNRSR
jgi:regulator of protease activity HflC (stomatin/prohibitin superfamily)